MEGEAVFLLQGEHTGHILVHNLGALTAEGRNNNLSIFQTQQLLGFGLGGGNKFLTDRHAHHFNRFRMLVVLDALFKTHQHLGGHTGCHLGGQAGQGVTFMDNRGYAQLCACINGREAGITTGADDHIRAKVTDDLLALGHCIDHALDCVDVLLDARHIQLTAQAAAGQGDQFIARCGNQLFLHVAFSANEENLAIRLSLLQYVGYGDCRIDVSGSTASGKHNFHKLHRTFQ